MIATARNVVGLRVRARGLNDDYFVVTSARVRDRVTQVGPDGRLRTVLNPDLQFVCDAKRKGGMLAALILDYPEDFILERVSLLR